MTRNRTYARIARLLLLACALRGSTAVGLDLAARATALQQHINAYPEIQPATRREEIHFQPVTLNTNRIVFEGVNYDCVRFRTGANTGTFYWAFSCSRRVANWYLLPATGALDQGFTRYDTGVLTQDVDLVAAAGTKMYLQTLPPGVLRPDSTYLIWFAFRDAAPITLAVSAALIDGDPIPTRQRYPVRKPDPPLEYVTYDTDTNRVLSVPANIVLTHPALTGRVTALEADLAAALSNRVAAKDYVSTAGDGLNLGIPPEGALLVGFRYGGGGFADSYIIKTLQPLYLTAQGLKPGQVFGRGNLGEAVLAPPGYAVGALRVRTGHRLDGFQVIFMKRRPGQLDLDPEDFKVSEWLGGQGGGGPRLSGGTGKAAIGIAIKSGADVDNLGLVLPR